MAFEGVSDACAREPWSVILPEQRHMQVRSPRQLPCARFPAIPTPPTVTDANPADACPSWNMPLDEAIRIGLANCDVIRVLGGSSGRTIYDPAVANTQIDVARGRFDPNLESDNNFYRNETPSEGFDPTDPSRVIIDGPATNEYQTRTGLTKVGPTGATASVGAVSDPRQYNTAGYPLNPRVPSSIEMSVTQPLLQGGGWGPNLAPIEIARIDTERSFFQMKDAVQEMVRGVIEAYWALVAARTDVWAREQQVKQTTEALNVAEARLRAGLGALGDVAQARSALADFRASLITAKATVLNREASLRNILGLPPSVPSRVIPVSPPSTRRLDVSWPDVLKVAGMRRPDLIELKLVLEADQQRLTVRRNDALPRVDAVALYRWNGLEGRTPDRMIQSTRPGQYTEWQLGVNFSVPLGLRASRARLREEQLVISRDRAELQQGFHNASHQLADNYRNLAQYYDLYRAYHDSRVASRKNLDAQMAVYSVNLARQGEQAIYLNVLQAITAWGNAVSAEAQALTAYNTELANLERQAGIILEAHGVRFLEERFASIGPLGRLFSDRCYPRDYQPGPNALRYPVSDKPAEDAFDLRDPLREMKRFRRGRQPVSASDSEAQAETSRIRVRGAERIEAPVPLPPVAPSSRN
jgi:outer membrane protein TolC